jgi:hypothetical protein
VPAKFCAVPGCQQVAVKTARTTTLCRQCYNTTVLPTVGLVWLEVTGPAPVTDARTQQSAGKGSVVALDPAETNVAALVAGGAGKVVDAPAHVKASKPPKA